MAFAYDDVPYDTEANAETHPGALATVARLAGLSPASPSTARVLEIGCGNGENLIAAATYLPDARFVGFDLAATAIAAGVAAARAAGTSNVTLVAADILDARNDGGPLGEGPFDFVVAHGMYSWVPEPVREALLALMRDALTPAGVGFLSVNALPGWELRRALREIARDQTRSIAEPAAKVAETMRITAEIARAGKDAPGFFGALAAAARAYEEQIARALPPEAPFSRDVFHDLLADENVPFSVSELERRLAAAGLRFVCETPLRPARASAEAPFDLARDLATTGVPFLQVLVQRDDAPPARELDPDVVRQLFLWADLTPVAGTPGAYRTTTGALVRPVGEEGLARAAKRAPGFVPVRELADDDASRGALARQLFGGFAEGVFTLVTEPPRVEAAAGERPRVADHVRARAAAAVERAAPAAILTNALHRSFRVPWPELAVVSRLDGAHDVRAIAEAASELAARQPSSLAGPLKDAPRRDVEGLVRAVIDRFTRHLFVVGDGA